jgi:glycosyltransferase involved in cell wall biosynthesis
MRGHAPTQALVETADAAIVAEAAIETFRIEHPQPSLPPLVVVIAGYNEGDNIGAVLDELPSRIATVPAACVVVDDGSTDDTAAVARSHHAFVCRLPVNRGHGVALRLGYRIAREGGARYIATLDADGQWDPGDLPAMVELLKTGSADIVIGSRRLGSTHNTNIVRNVGVHVFGWLISALTGVVVTDTSSGLRVMRAEMTGVVTQTQPQYQTSELLIGAIYHGYHVAEAPTTMRRRLGGETKKGHSTLYGSRYARVILRTWRRERRARAERDKAARKSVSTPLISHAEPLSASVGGPARRHPPS